MSLFVRFIASLLLTALLSANVIAQAPTGLAPNGEALDRVWHLGRVTGDLERIIQFYHDLLGLDLRGEREQDIPFYTVDTINEFVGTPQGAEFRAAFLPIQGTSAATEPGDQIYLEAFEFRNIDRHLMIPALSDTGVSNLKFIVSDLDQLLVNASADGVSIISAGAEPLVVPTLAGLSGSARAIMLRDPDGYPVELIEITPATSSNTAPISNSQIRGQ